MLGLRGESLGEEDGAVVTFEVGLKETDSGILEGCFVRPPPLMKGLLVGVAVGTDVCGSKLGSTEGA